MQDAKPFGYELVDIKLSGVIARPEIEQQGAEAFCVPLRVSFKILDLRRLSLGSADPSEYSRS